MNNNWYCESKIKKWVLLILVSFGAGTFYLTPFLMNQYINQIQAITNISLVDLQLLLTIYGVISLVLYIPGGWVADRVSPKLLFSSSMFSAALLSVWYSLIGFQGVMTFSQLIIIYILYAIINSLIFWSAFIKVVGLMDETKKHVQLYANTEIWRGLSNVLVAFISFAIISITISSTLFDPHAGGNLFAVLIFYAFLYMVIGLLTCFLMPGPWWERFIKKNPDGHYLYKPLYTTEIMVVTNKEELQKIKSFYREKFWKQVHQDFLYAIKNKYVWMISFLIFFIMNAYAIITAFGTIFSINYGISAHVSSFISYLYNYGTPIIGALIVSKWTQKYTKSPTKSLFQTNLILIAMSLIMVILTGINKNYELSLGIIGVVILCLIMLLIGANRAIYWSILNEVKILWGVVGIVAGFISIIGFSENIWVNPVAALIMKPFKIDSANAFAYNHYAFMYLYIFNLVNVIGATMVTYLIYQHKQYGKFFTKYQVFKDMFSFTN